jgi:hypothetical protein
MDLKWFIRYAFSQGSDTEIFVNSRCPPSKIRDISDVMGI